MDKEESFLKDLKKTIKHKKQNKEDTKGDKKDYTT